MILFVIGCHRQRHPREGWDWLGEPELLSTSMLLVYQFWHERGQLTHHKFDVPAIPPIVIAAGNGRAIIVGEYKSLVDVVRQYQSHFSLPSLLCVLFTYRTTD
jgi:hypothetical protein